MKVSKIALLIPRWVIWVFIQVIWVIFRLFTSNTYLEKGLRKKRTPKRPLFQEN